MSENSNPLQKLQWVMEQLLGPKGCPWDKEQTHKSLAPFAIEEAHELAESLENEDWRGIKEELGDFLFQVIFHCALAQKGGRFTLEDVCQGISEKLIRRHPHVFGDLSVKDSDEVLKNWDAIKSTEGKTKTRTFDIPVSLPSLQRSQKIGDKTKNLKFDWGSSSEVIEKLDEEIFELKEAIQTKTTADVNEELGDVFFVLAQLARHLKLDAESSARQANSKFEKRFEKMLNLAVSRGLDFQNLKTEEKEELWEEIKKS